MKTSKVLSLALLILLACVTAANAGDQAQQITEKKIVIAVKTDDIDLKEMDISHLQPGDSETIVTDSGKTVDILKTEDDVEIYVNGKLLDVGPHMKNRHGDHPVHVVHKQVEINCDSDEDCEEMVWTETDGVDRD